MKELDKMNICALAVLTLNAIQTAVNAKSRKAELATAAEKAEILARMLRSYGQSYNKRREVTMESNAIHRISALLSFYDHKKVVVMTRDYEKFTQHVLSMLSGVSLQKICKHNLGVHDKRAVTDAVMAVQDAQLSLYHLDAKDDPDEVVAQMRKQNPDFILVDNSIPAKHQLPQPYLTQLPGIVIMFNKNGVEK